MDKDLTREERELYRGNGGIRTYSDGELQKMLDEMEMRSKFGADKFPAHAEPLRTSSGVRFGW